MRDLIARALLWALALLLPATGRHRATPEPEQPTTPPVEYEATKPAPESPWLRPWTSPSKADAAEIFRRQAETARERRRAAELATVGVDYPYTYPGAPFPAASFRVAEVAA